MSIYLSVYKTKWSIEARHSLIGDSYFFLENLQTMIKDYTIDYEEYWNRSIVGCHEAWDPSWWTWACSLFTHYWNYGGIYGSRQEWGKTIYPHRLFYCSTTEWGFQLGNANVYNAGTIYSASECLADMERDKWISNPSQAFWQYEMMFTDVRDLDNTDDDTPVGIIDKSAIYSTGDDVPTELYLISIDGTRRLFFRRRLIEHFTGYTTTNQAEVKDADKLWTIEVLQLRGFDAGENHDFDKGSVWVYDGKIDTWACDTDAGYVCNGNSIWGVYSDYYLPEDANDWRHVFLNTDITVSDWKLYLQPLDNPLYAYEETETQINPHLRILFLTKLFGKNWSRKVPRSQMDQYALNIQTMFSFQPMF